MITVLGNEDVSYLDSLFLVNGKIHPVPAAEIAKVPQTHLMIWANKNAIYTYPTEELIQWLKEQIGTSNAIEICCGSGCIGKSLGIPMTDSFCQLTPEILLYYNLLKQKPTQPSSEAFKFEANEAVAHFKPDVVIGSYVTQKYNSKEKIGVDELALLKNVKKYITIGNYFVHKDKRIRQISHKKYQFPWLFTRASKPEGNEILVWEQK